MAEKELRKNTEKEEKLKLPLHAEMQITLALIHNAKNWKSEDSGNFWSYISLQFG